MTFYLLALSIFCVFPYCKLTLMRQPLWIYLMVVSVISAYYEAHINVYGVVSLIFYVALYFCLLTVKKIMLGRIVSVAFVAASLALALHYIPGFNNLPIVVNEAISTDAIAYTLYANFDKGIAGLLLAAYFFSSNTGTVKIATANNLKIPLLIIGATILSTLMMALVLGLVHFDFKVPDFWFAFIAINLFFTCVAEEALFRGILQHKLAQVITSPRLALLAPIIVACIFGLAHFVGGISYIFVAAVAGLGYGTIYYKTQRLEWAILCHWLVDVCHFFFFTYPMLNVQT
ncbi:lysostaphin resistance A-like protein [Psychromonas sp. PT13]|uniref:CPBP family intramembrane glutamic endopeptidase n=1 Tax=Psychromonas sp. PT13 TaxID=3439547 RepID=UPI003EB9E3B1